MRDLLELQYAARFIQYAEPTDDGDGVMFSAIVGGRLVVAESLALMISALQDTFHSPLMLAA